MYDNNYLMHHGVKGMKWGIRKHMQARNRFQASDKRRYGKAKGRMNRDLRSTKNFNERIKIMEKGRRMMNEGGLLDAGYSK